MYQILMLLKGVQLDQIMAKIMDAEINDGPFEKEDLQETGCAKNAPEKTILLKIVLVATTKNLSYFFLEPCAAVSWTHRDISQNELFIAQLLSLSVV